MFVMETKNIVVMVIFCMYVTVLYVYNPRFTLKMRDEQLL